MQSLFINEFFIDGSHFLHTFIRIKGVGAKISENTNETHGADFHAIREYPLRLVYKVCDSKTQDESHIINSPLFNPAIDETIKIMRALGQNVPQKDLDQKRLDALNGFVFNVDTPADLVQVYARYYMRSEPLDTLEKIQDAFFSAKKENLRHLAAQYLDPDNLQIFLVGDKNIKVKGNGSKESTLGDMLMDLADALGLPFVELELR